MQKTEINLSKEERYKLGEKATIIGIVANIVLTGIKGFIGIISGSVALLADAVHSLSDVLSSVIVFGGLKYAQAPPDENHHYGHAKAESIVAKIVAIMLILAAAGIGYTAWQVLLSNDLTIPGTIALGAAALSIIVKEGLYQYTVRIADKIKSPAVKADAWHHRTDALSSVAALIGIGGALLGYPILDPIAGVVVAIMIAKAAFEIYWSAIKDLMDEAPTEQLMESIIELTTNVEGIYHLQEVKGRMHGTRAFIDMKICVDRNSTVEEGHELAKVAKLEIMEKHNEVEDVLIHVNPCIYIEDKEPCKDCEKAQEFKS